MAAQFVFPFLSLFFYFQLLLSAAVEVENQVKCGGISHQCGYLGEISFPFNTVNNTECGFYVLGCDNNSTVKEIQLAGNQFKIYSIQKQDNQIFIYGNSASEIDSVSHKINNMSNHISLDTISFHGCSHSSTCENMLKYRNCPEYDYDIYFPSDEHDHRMFPIFPFPCSPVQFFEGLAAPDPPDHCRLLFSLLQIRVELDESCEYYCHEGIPSHLNHSDFTCVPALYPAEPPRDDDAKGTPPGAGTEDNKRRLKAVILGLSIVLVTVIAIALLVIILVLYNRRIKSSGVENQSRSTSRALTRNATIPESGAVYFGIPVFSYEELQEATNNFDQARELGEGGFGTVYYGKLQDGREVAVKRLFERNYRPVEQFTNEIQILTRMRHINLVSLYGCTSRHSRELLLVYEYVPNGTVSCHLHGDKTKKHGSLPWHVRMKIAIETASALTYLHASDIIHRDVKSSNILLDNNFCVKVADFGLSRLFPNDVTHVSTAPKGTPGYVDPDYRLCYQLTSKSDVYSFGVVLVELISSLPAVDLTRDRDDIKLANLARRKIQRREFCELIDPSLGFQSDDGLKRMIISVAELAFHCLQGDKELRPSMSEVLEVLQRIESWKDEPAGNIDLESINVNGARVAQSYVHPSLPNTWMELQRHPQTL